MNQVAAVAELVGSPRGRRHARAIYNKTSACADLFQIQEVILAAAPGEVAGEMAGGILFGGIFRGKLIGGMIRKKYSEVLLFDVEKAKVLCDELRVAIDDFIEAVNTVTAYAARVIRRGVAWPAH